MHGIDLDYLFVRSRRAIAILIFALIILS